MTSALLAIGPAPDGEPPLDDAPVEAPADGPSEEETLSLVEKAQAHLDAGEFDEALESAYAAILSDPEFGPLYLLRSEIQIELAGAAEGLEKARLLTAAAADLERYLGRSDGGEADAQLLTERDALLTRAESVRRDVLDREAAAMQAEAAPPEPPKPEPPPPDPTPPALDDRSERRADRVVIGTLSTAGVLAAAAAVAGSTALVIERRCPDLCSADFRIRPLGLSVALIGSAGATAFASWGVARWARSASPRARRTAAAVTGSLAGAATVVAVTMASVAAARWGSVSPSAQRDLATTQRLGNAAVVSGVFVAPLLSSAIVAAIPRKSAGRATARK